MYLPCGGGGQGGGESGSMGRERGLIRMNRERRKGGYGMKEIDR